MVECPSCLSKGRVASSKRVSAGLRELYCQCMNLNCGKVFVLHLSLSHYIKPRGTKPDPELQPDLCNNEHKVDTFNE